MIIDIILTIASILGGVIMGQNNIKSLIDHTIKTLDENEVTDAQFRDYITNSYRK